MYFRLAEAGGRYGNPLPIRCPSTVSGRCAQIASRHFADALIYLKHKSWEGEGKFLPFSFFPSGLHKIIQSWLQDCKDPFKASVVSPVSHKDQTLDNNPIRLL